MAVVIFLKNNSYDTTTLATRAALLVQTILGSSVRNFMFKNIRSEVFAIQTDLADRVMLVLANSDATVAQVATAMGNNSVNLEDRVNYANGQQEVRVVWDFVALDSPQSNKSNVMHIQWRIPPKGIPTLRGGGLSIFAFNYGTVDLVNGALGDIQTKSMGGWF